MRSLIYDIKFPRRSLKTRSLVKTMTVQTKQILAAYQEGEIVGIIKAIEFYCPNISKKQIGVTLKGICKNTHTDYDLDC